MFSPELRAHVKDWPTLYHLTPYRGTILDALGLHARDARVLELGAGCGAVTRWLGERFHRVDAVEGSPARAWVARERTRDLPGVRVAAANFFDLDFAAGGGYDLATLIGVLEYSHLFHPDKQHDPDGAALDNLELVRRGLAPDGALIVAIENKLGLRYLAGGHEDHASRRWEGIEGYPSRRSAVTWSANELEALLLRAGFTAVDFYLPFPDYKLATTVLDAAAAHPGTYPANWVDAPFPDRAGPGGGTRTGDALFDESLALREVVKSGLLRDLANSFVVVAVNGDRAAARARLGIDEGWVARHWSLDRRAAFAKRASLELDPAGSGDLVVVNTCAVADPQPAPAAELIGLAQRLAPEPFRRGHNALLPVLEALAGGRLPQELPAVVARLAAFLQDEFAAPGAGHDAQGIPFLRGDALDVTLWNLVADEASGAWHAIDGEWSFQGVLPADYVVWRGLLHAASKRPALAAGSGAPDAAQFALALVRRVWPSVEPERLRLYHELEGWLQRAAGAAPGDPRPTPSVQALVEIAREAVGFRAVAAAEELAAHPELVAAFAEAFPADGEATLVAYAPGADPAELAPRLEAALAAGAPGRDLDVVLVAPAPDEVADRRLAASVHALLSLSPASGAGPFARLPRVGPGEAARLRLLARPAPHEEVA